MAFAESMRSCFETESLFSSESSSENTSDGDGSGNENAYSALNARTAGRIHPPNQPRVVPRVSVSGNDSGSDRAERRRRNLHTNTGPRKPTAADEHNEVDLLLNASSLASSEAIETPTTHPSVGKRKKWKHVIRAQENFEKPDAFGNIECPLCKFGIFDSEGGSATTKLMRIYERQIGQMHDETLYRYMANYWNDSIATDSSTLENDIRRGDVDSDEIPIPTVTVSQIHYHFESCFSRRNVVGILFNQIDKLLKIQNRVYENGVFVRTVSEDELRKAELDGVQRPTPMLTQDANGNIIDEYANTIRSEPPEQTFANEPIKDDPLFSQITSMIKEQLEFVKKLQAEIPLIENPQARRTQEELINTYITKIFKDIRKCQAMERMRRKKVDKKYLVHSKEAAVFRDYNRAILYTIRGLKEWRDVSTFMDGDTDPGAPRKKKAAAAIRYAKAKLSGPAADTGAAKKTPAKFNPY